MGIKVKGRRPSSFAGGFAIGVAFTAVLLSVMIFLVRPFAVQSNTSPVITSEQNDLLTEQANEKLETLYEVIGENFYHDERTETLQEGLYRGLLESLDDPYAVYYTPEEYAKLENEMQGDYSGIGVANDWDQVTHEVIITEVYPDSPAERAGLQKGDQILSADGILAADYDMEAFSELILGEKGTQVELGILRGEEELTFTLTRDDITLRSVTHQMTEDGIGYLRMSQFILPTYTEFTEALAEMQSNGMKGLMIDLRGNLGGLVDSAVDILDDILPEGMVVHTEDKYGNGQAYCSDGEHCIKIPIVVLVDGDTASAAEIFTAAIRDFQYGTIVGTTTYGKGIVQSTIPLDDGSAVKLTTETYYPPSGKSFHGVGITPDVVLEYEFLGTENDKYDLSLDNQYLCGLEILREQMRDADVTLRK